MCARGAKDFDEIADALGNRERRQVLLELTDHNPVTYPGKSGENEREYGEEELSMVHVHLPKLDSMGYVSWNQDAGTVVKGARWEEIEPVIQLLDEHREELPSGVF